MGRLKCEYLVINKVMEGKMPDDDLQIWLNEMYDTKGWSLVAVDKGQFIFERISERTPNG